MTTCVDSFDADHAPQNVGHNLKSKLFDIQINLLANFAISESQHCQPWIVLTIRHCVLLFQEKFERDQEKIRRQYEEEKRAAREAEKKKQDEVRLVHTDMSNYLTLI